MSDRRDFLKGVVAAGVVARFGSVAQAESSSGIPTRTLGPTGQQVSMLGLGGYHLGRPTEAEAIKIVRTAADNGITFMDNCWDYNGGDSEVRMGKALRDGYRQQAFLMTKVDGRTKEAAARQMEECLQRLQTDHIDLMQMHEVIRMGDPERVFAPGGGMEALAEAKKAGKIRHIGFTGHKSPDIHLHMLKIADEHKFQLDAVLMPVNVMDAHFESFVGKVMPVLVQKKIGIQTMKPMGGGIILQSKTVSAPECLRFAMSQPTDVVITGCDSMEIVQQALNTARNFKAMNQEEIAALLARTASAASQGQFELYKTSADFDGTAHNPHWMGS